jgi:general stress protein 26
MDSGLNAPKVGAWVIVFACLLAPIQGLRAQETVPRETLMAAAREIIEEARYCALVTFDESGTVRVRMMDPFSPEEDMTIWMGTSRRTRKVHEIESDPRVTLYYTSPDVAGYVSISGKAILIDDPMEKASRWKEGWEGFYSDREADYILIQVIPERMEVINYSRGIGGDPETWDPPFIEFTGGQSRY